MSTVVLRQDRKKVKLWGHGKRKGVLTLKSDWNMHFTS